MIAQGVDGVSRGSTTEGVMGGAEMLSFIPLHVSALEQTDTPCKWLTSWVGNNAEILTPNDWFERGHDISDFAINADGFSCPTFSPGVFIWAPPPAAADVALEELRKARVKRQCSMHVFVCPRIFTPQWLRQLHKAADLVFSIPSGTPMWPSSMFEPCLIGILFPFHRCKPWQLRGTPKMYAVGRSLSRMWENLEVDSSAFLRQFCTQCRSMESLPEHVVSKLLFLR